MGQVIAFRKTSAAIPEVVEYFESMAAKARCGAVRGWMGIFDPETGKPRRVVLGSFAEDPERAARAAEKWVDVLRSQAGKKGGEVDDDYVPARLRAR
jgi:hypothetical protein